MKLSRALCNGLVADVQFLSYVIVLLTDIAGELYLKDSQFSEVDREEYQFRPIVDHRRNLQFTHFCQLPRSICLLKLDGYVRPPPRSLPNQQHHHHGQYEYVLKKKLDRPDHNESHYYQQLHRVHKDDNQKQRRRGGKQRQTEANV
ncbi:hypothetical protein HID58_034467 [Brassica napus]|uniref:Uncharacterized protein n=1 Tax=Brassica napus TaxID=3708 RepID=A0ABQ8C248_BRANA|nr:hypothetical protein HID58_034467 [Brassica napus]